MLSLRQPALPVTLLGIIILSGLPIPAAGRLAISEPAPDSRLKGTIMLAANDSNLESAETVEFLLNERLVAGPVPAPFKVSWNSASVWDGPGLFKAVARDGQGNIISVSAGLPVTVANGVTSVRVLSPSPDTTVSGSISFQVEISRPNGAPVPVDGVMFFVDGYRINTAFSAGPAAPTRSSTTIDTSQFPNGAHILFAGVHANEPGNPPVAMAQIAVHFENGRTASQLLPKWRDVILLPGESAPLDPRILFTNGEREAASSVSYSTSDSSIAEVDREGNVTGRRVGIATVKATSRSLTSTVRVLVNAARQFPHYAGDGAALLDHDPDRSFFPRSLFYLEPKLVDTDSALNAEAKAASINALEAGFYLAKQDLNNPQSFDDFRRNWDPHWARLANVARTHGYKLVLNGDNMARFPSLLNDNLTWPWAPEAINYVFTTMRDSKLAVALEMVDESSGMWGSTPFPTDGRWMRLNPPIPDDAFVRLMRWINAVEGRPPLSWPILWLTGPQVAANWMGDPRMSDYASNYWDLNDWRHAYPWGMSLPQIHDALDNVIVKRMPVLQRDRPALQLISINGPYYTKLGPGEQFTPGQDRQQAPALRPEAVGAQVMYAVALGQAGIRAYGFDWEGWKNDRKNASIGTGDRQTGADPFTVGTDRWQAMGSAFRLLSALEPYVFYPQINAVNLGSAMVTGAREGAKGRMFIAVNFLDQTVTTRVDRSPYVYPDASSQLRYSLHGASLGSEKVANEYESDETFLPGETKVWIFEPEPATPAVRIVRPLLGEVVSGTELVDAISAGWIAQSELWVDGARISTQEGLAPFSWNVYGGSPNAWRSVVIRAYDDIGQVSEARVGVRNPAEGIIPYPEESSEMRRKSLGQGRSARRSNQRQQ